MKICIFQLCQLKRPRKKPSENEHTKHPDSEVWISHPTSRNQGSLRKCLILGLGQKTYNMSLGHLLPKKEGNKDEWGVSVGHRSKCEGAFNWPKMGQCEQKLTRNWLKHIKYTKPSVFIIMQMKRYQKYNSVETTESN